MAFCIQCGVHNPDEAIFCLGCGQALYRLPKPRSRRLILVLSTALLMGFFGVATLWFEHEHTSDNPPKAVQPKAAESSTASTLMIIALDRKGSAISQGSGFVLTSEGLAGSNYHVLKGAARVLASSSDGRVYEVGSIEGADLDKDLVVFQLYPRGSSTRPHDLKHVVLGSSANLSVGEKVIAIGSPQGLKNTVSDGILSALREVDGTHILQITAPVSPGSSGGPVLNSAGEMIGIATFQLKRGQNLNFAVAVDYLKPLLEQNLQISVSDFQSIVGDRTRRSAVRSAEASASSVSDQQVDQTPAIGSSTYASLTGEFAGVVHNLSVNVSAEFAVFVDEHAGQLSGCMLVKKPLFGSGPLQGYVDGQTIVFSVTSAIGKITAWGKRSDHDFSGTYLVEHEGHGGNENGTFTLQKVSSNGMSPDFDPSRCPSDAEVHK